MPRKSRACIAITLALLAVFSMVLPAGAALGGPEQGSPGVATPSGGATYAGGETVAVGGGGPASTGGDVDPRPADGDGGPPVDPALENASGRVEVIVRFEEARETPGASANSVSALQTHAQQSQAGFREYARVTDAVEIHRSFWITNAMLVELNASEVAPGQLLQLGGVERIHDNFDVQALESDPEIEPATSEAFDESRAASHGGDAPYNGTYGLHVVNATRTWEAFGTRGEGVNVTVLDTGVNASHPDIDLGAWARINSNGAITNTSVANASDHDGHGTHVSGTVVGGNASGEYIGVAPNATLNHGQVLGPSGGTFAQVTAGMEWAVNGTSGSNGNFSDVISMSLGSPGYTAAFIDHVRNVRAQGIPLFVATGNTGEWRSGSPGNIYESISVGAIDETLTVAGFSNGEPIDTSEVWGNDAPISWPSEYVVPEITAPGVAVLSANASNGGYTTLQGTSMATPHVSGVAALMLAANGSLSDEEIETTLEETATDPYDYTDPDHRYGYGIVDALNATASVTADTTVSGQVTNATGIGIANATVRTEYGLQTRTNATGWYEMEVPSTEHNLTADPLGFEPNATLINGSGTGTIEQNFSVSTPTPEARLVGGTSLYSNSTDGVNLTYRVASVGNYSIEFDGGTYASASEATLSIDGTDVSFGENATIDATDPATITVSLDPDDGFYGSVALNHTFYNRSGPGTYADRSSPVMLHDDPISVGSGRDVDPSSLQDLIDTVDEEATLRLDDTTYSETYGGSTVAVNIDRPIAIEAASGDSPTIDVPNQAASAAIYVNSPGVRLAGLDVDAGGSTYNVYTTTSGLDLVDSEIHNAGYGVYLGGGIADRISNTSFHALYDGIYSRNSVSGDVRSIDNNTAWNIDSAAINISSSETPDTAITDNDFTIDSGGTAAIVQLANVSEISGNEITLNGSSTDGIVTDGAPESTGTVVLADNRITGGDYGVFAVSPGVDTIRNNTVQEGARGIYVRNHDRQSVLIEENDIENATTYGIRGWNANNVAYRNNTIDGADGNGIVVQDSLPVDVQNVTVSNNTITNVSRASGGPFPAVLVTAVSDLDVDDNDLSGAGVLLNNTQGVDARRNAIANASNGVEVTGNSSDVLLQSPTFTNVDRVFWTYSSPTETPSNVTLADANVTTDDGTVYFDDVPAADVGVTNVSLADGTTVNASGHNASLSVDQDPSGSSFPANRSDAGAFLNLTDEGAGSQLDVNVSYDDGDVSALREDTLQFYRYNGTGWEPVSTTGVDATANDVWASLDSFSTFAPLAEITQANFSVTSIEANASTVLEGDTVQINATINNTGDASATQNVTLDVNDSVGTVDHRNVTIGAGNETTIALNWTTAEAGDYSATVQTDDDSNATSVRVDAPANFTVNVTGTNSPVIAGETLDVNATIKNTGDVRGNQTVELEVARLTNGSLYTFEDSQTFALNASENRTISLDWSTDSDQAGNWSALVSSANDFDQRNVTVQEPANFSVTIDSTNSPVTEGENLTVDATINNTGDVTGTQDVNLTIDGTQEDVVTAISLDAGENTTETFTWTTADGDNGTYTAAINSENDSTSRTVDVQTPANFTVAIDARNSSVVAGETLQVNATINNTGETTDTQDVTLDVGGSQRDSQSVMLNGSENESVTLTWSTAEGDVGNYTAFVNSSNDTASTSVEVQEPANYTVSIDSTNSPVLESETLQVNATINNTGDVDGSQTVNLSIDDGVGEVATQQVELGGGNETTITLEWTNTSGQAGSYNATVAATTDSDSTTVEVDEPANFTVSELNATTPVLEGETVDVNATIENVGDRNATQTVNLTIGGIGEIATQSVDLNSSESKEVTLSWDTTGDGPGNYTATVSSSNDSDSAVVRVDDRANFSIVNVTVSASEIVAGRTLSVNATIENVGDVSGNQSIRLDVIPNSTGGLPDYIDDQRIHLNASERETVSFSWTPNDSKDGIYDVAVSSENETLRTPVEVLAPANVTVNVTGSNSPVSGGETLQVDATLNNTGDVRTTQNVTLDVDGSQRDSQSVTLNGSENQSVTLEWQTNGLDAGNYSATVSSVNDSDAAAIQVENASVYFAVTGIDAPATVSEGESFDVTANVTNYGTALNATQNLTYSFDNATIATQTNVTLNASETTQVTFTHSNATAGDYTHGVSTANETNSTSITIEADSGGGGGLVFIPAPPSGDEGPNLNFVLSTLIVSPTEVAVGEQVTVEVRVDNDGEDAGEFTGTLTADGEAVDEGTVSVNANWHETLTLSTSFDEPGTYDLVVNGESAGSVTVVGGSNLVITETNIETSSVRAGETVRLTTTVRNDGEVEGSRTVTLDVGGETVDSRTVTLGPGESETVTFEHTFSTAGSHEVAVGGERLPNVEVRESQVDDGGGRSSDDSGDGVLLVFLGVLGVVVAAGSLTVYLYGDEIGELLEG